MSIKGVFGVIGLTVIFFIIFGQNTDGVSIILSMWNRAVYTSGSVILTIMMLFFIFCLGYIFETTFQYLSAKDRPKPVEKEVIDEQEASGFAETCPVCHKFVYDEYCSGCGQHLKWD